MNDVAILTRRRLQAEVIKPIYEEMVETIGESEARQILDRAIRKAAIREGKELASTTHADKTGMQSFIDRFEMWTRGGALEVNVHEANESRFEFDVTRCRYAEMYREMGLADIGRLLSCNRDGSFCIGFDSNIKLDRAKTIMDGDPCCTFRYRYDVEGT